ncbi:MAG: ACT domain-containing protein, partial [Planctomycetes bacterium]|nr:ACT domain-containing protein [Planctomycetota bacterium]
MMPTASAVVADIIEIATGSYQQAFKNLTGKDAEETKSMISDIGNIDCRFYVRLMAADRPGVVAAFSKILGDHEISLTGVLQHEGTGPDNTVPVVVTTHPTSQKNMTAALEELARSDVVGAEPVCIRIVDIPEDQD